MDAALVREEVAELHRDEGREAAVDAHVEAKAGIGLTQGDDAVDQLLLVGIEIEGHIDVVDRAGALGRQIDRRRTLDVEQRRDQAARRFMQVKINVEPSGLVGESGREVQRSTGRVEPLHVQLGVEHPAREAERALERQTGGVPEDGLLQRQGADGEPSDIDRHRQLGQGEGLRLGGRQCGRGLCPLAEPRDQLGTQLVDVDAAAEQGEPAPVELDVVDRHPGAGLVGNCDPLDPRP